MDQNGAVNGKRKLVDVNGIDSNITDDEDDDDDDDEEEEVDEEMDIS
jgi:hypothetical protein